MKLVSILGIAVLAALVAAAPSTDDNLFTMDSSLVFGNFDVIYNTKHEVVSLILPLNGVNSGEDDKVNGDSDISLFFVEADINEKGVKKFQGVSLLKDKKATKILENGTHASTDLSNSKNVYISATDGLYVYNSESGKVERYGSITDNLINVAKMNSKEELYVLTADNYVYRVTDNGEKKVKVDGVKGAKQIILDNSDNLYYIGADKQLYVVTKNGVKVIIGVPYNPSSAIFIKPPFLTKDVVLYLADKRMYFVKADGTSEAGSEYQLPLSAIAMEGVFIHYFAFDKTIWYLLYPNLITDAQVDSFKKAFKDKADKIQSIASRVKSRRDKLTTYF